MNSRFVILPYKLGSAGAKALAQSLTQSLGAYVRRVSGEGSYRPKARSIVCCWGADLPAGWTRGLHINRDPSVARHKGRTFAAFRQHGVPTVDWTTSREEAQSWLTSGHVVLSRQSVTGASGQGIVVAEPGQSVAPAPLYTQYKAKQKEFRVHVVNNQVIDVSEKRKRTGGETTQGYIRNSANGWVFCHDNIQAPADLSGVALSAVRACSLDFGAVDIIWNQLENRCYALEVNSAPGIEGTTLQRYTDAIRNAYVR